MASHQSSYVLLLFVSLLLLTSVSNALKITYPPSLAGAIASLRGSFSGVLPPYTAPITSDLILANPCAPITVDITGKIVFSSVDAGVCLYYNQTMTVVNAGGIGLILSKTSPTFTVLPMLYTASKLSTPIPCVSIDGVNAARIKAELLLNNTVTAQLGYAPALSNERQALVDFWTATSGPTWTFGATGQFNAWNSATDPCSAWYGVLCDDNTGAVTGISLPLNGLKGNVPSSISQLTSMTQMQLSANAITGLPDAAFQFPNMIAIEASGDAIATGFPSNMGAMTSLMTLNLGSNKMTGSIPDSLSLLTNLRTIQLNGNAFTGTIPTNIGNLDKVTMMTLSINSMSGTIPSSLGGMTALTRLELATNTFGGALPDSIAQLTNLAFLDISANTFSGAMPSQIIALTKLTYLNVAKNALTGNLPSLSSAKQMLVMDISNNQFTGPLDGRAFSSVITSIKAAHNQFTSIIGFSGLSALLSVDVSYNNLQLFTDIQNLPKTTQAQINQGISGLTSIDLSHNNLKNVTLLFDMSLENWPSLTSMNLAYNRLGGVLAPPTNAAASQYLKTINLANNFIEGSIPAIFGNLPSLTTFDIRNNSVHHGTGPLIPTFALADYSTLYDWPQGHAYCPSFSKGQLLLYVDNAYHDYMLCQCKTSYRRSPGAVPLQCAECPDHLICDNKRVNDSTYVFEAGWFPSPTFDDPIKMIECPNCMQSSSLNFECQEGYSDRLCSKCLHGYYLRGGKCEMCHPSGVILFCVVIVIVMAIIIYFSVIFSRTSEKMLQSASSVEFVSNRVEVGSMSPPPATPLGASTTAVVSPTSNSPNPTLRNSTAFLTSKDNNKPKKQVTILKYFSFEPSLAIVTIIINYTQTLSILCRYFSLDYSLRQVLGIAAVANVSGTGFGIECIKQALAGTHERYLFNSLQPIAVTVASGFAALMGIVIFRLILKQSFRWWLVVCGRTLFFLLDFLFFPVLIDCISIFRCEEDPATEVSYLSDFQFSRCDIVPLGQKVGFLLLNLLGIYGLFIFLLIMYRRSTGTRKAHIFTMFGFFFSQYKREYFYAGIFYLTRRLIFSIINGLLATVSLQLFISNMIFIIFSIMLVYTIRPFKRSVDNYYEVASYVSLAFCYSVLFVGNYTNAGITKAFFWVFINCILYLGFIVVLAASKIPTWADMKALIMCEWAKAKVERYDEE